MIDEVWSLVEVTVHEDVAEIVADRLWLLGVAAVEELPADAGFVRLRTNLGDHPSTVIAALHEEFPSAECEVVNVSRHVADTWREFVSPTWIDPDVVVVPAWLDPPVARHLIRIEPHDTFGLGNHPTTVLAARMILRHVSPGAHIFDFGCGSGVLAIVATLVEGTTCEVFDIAPGAQGVVERNLELNRIDSTRVRWADTLATMPDDCFDVVVANILAPVLREFAPEIIRVTRDDGVVILAGLRSEQVDDVARHYTQFSVSDVENLDGWSAVVLGRTS